MGVQSAQGLDVADFQGRFDWKGAKARTPGLAFGIYRLTQGLGAPGTASPDPDAAWNHEQIAANGLRRGAYHFLDPKLPGAAQAEYFVEQARHLGLDTADMLWLDNETEGASPAATAQCARDFMAKLDHLAPHNPRGVYTFIDFARNGSCAGLGNYALWLAFPSTTAPAAPPPWNRWTFWQWGQRGTDQDAFNGTSADLDAWIRSFAPEPSAGPFRHVADGHHTLAQIAAQRNTTALHLLTTTASALTPADEAEIACLPLPAGFPFYTTNP